MLISLPARLKTWFTVAAAEFGLVVAVWLGYLVSEFPKNVNRQIQDSPQSTITYSDHLTTLERITKSESEVKKNNAYLKKLPGKVSRVSSFQVAPTKPGPVAVDIVTTETPEGTRVSVHSDDATVTGGQDVVIHRPAVPEYRWNVQALAKLRWNDPKPVYGLQVSYGRGPFVGSVAVFPSDQEVIFGLGIRF